MITNISNFAGFHAKNNETDHAQCQVENIDHVLIMFDVV